MGHAEHFLSRLSRLDADQEELALALYRDPPLVRAVIKEAKVPEGAGRVALALTSAATPPHVLVTRDGAFVTCLGEGMSVRDAAVVPHLKFLELRENVFSLREIWDRARATADDNAGVGRAATNLLEKAGAVTSEEMRIAIDIAPLWGLDALHGYAELSRDLVTMRDNMMRRPKSWSRSTQARPTVHFFWKVCWAVSSFALVATAIDPERRGPRAELAKIMSKMFYEAMKCSFLPFAIRMCWVMARFGGLAADILERDADESAGSLIELFACIGLAAIGATDPEQRERAKRFFAAREGREASPGIADFRDGLGRGLDDPGEPDDALVRRGREEIWEASRLRGRVRWSSCDHVPGRLARAWMATRELDLFGRGGGLGVLALSTPWLGRAKPEELYLPAAEPAMAEVYSAERGLQLLDGFRRFNGNPPPVHAEPVPGRNEPCPCGSGKKFKKCCAAA